MLRVTSRGRRVNGQRFVLRAAEHTFDRDSTLFVGPSIQESTTTERMTDIEKDPVALALPPGAVATPTEVATGSAVREHNRSDMYQQEKVGARCCGFCCDYRRAVIILCFILCLFSLGFLVFALASPDTIPTAGVEYDDDEEVPYEDSAPIAWPTSLPPTSFSILAKSSSAADKARSMRSRLDSARSTKSYMLP